MIFILNIQDYYFPLALLISFLALLLYFAWGNDIRINDNKKHAKKSGYNIDGDENSYS